MKRYLILSILILACCAIRDNPYKEKLLGQPEQQNLYAQTEHTFNQVVDHFDYRQQSFFKQRYWSIQDYYNPSAGPVFLFICGEYVCKGVPQARQWVVTMAQRLQGLILVLQHRFYGKSLPFGNHSFSIENMKLLNSQQALSDLAYFLNEVKVNKMHRVTDKSPWISIGGSYPGALSAWFRLKYPHLTIGGIASSAVIVAIEDFPEFDEQIYNSSSKSSNECMKALNDSSTRVEQILKSGEGATFKASFKGGDKLQDKQFLFFWVDSIVGIIQYGKRVELCNSLKGKSSDDQFNYLVQNAKTQSVYEYGSYYLSNQTFQIISGQGARCWYFQSCTEFGFWQTYSTKHRMRSKLLDINFYKQFCSDSFGSGIWPKIDRKNTEYGGLNINTTYLLMANGQEDPWRWASLQQSRDSIISRVANCDNCAHCVDLYTPLTSDSPQLKKIRNQQFLEIMSWIQNYWRTHNQHLSTE